MNVSVVEADFIAAETDVTDPILREIYRYWDGLPVANGRRDYRRFDALEVSPAVLPHITVMEILAQGRDLRYRLVGTHIDENVGFALSGMTLSDTPFQDKAGILAKVLHSVESGRPQFFMSKHNSCADFFQQVARLYLPMTRDGEAYDVIVGGAVISRRPHSEGSLKDHLEQGNLP